MKQWGVSHPFVDEDEARPVLIKERPQPVTRARRLFVVGSGSVRKLLCRRAARQALPKACARQCHRVSWTGCPGKSCFPRGRRSNFGQQVHLCVLHDAVDAPAVHSETCRKRGDTAQHRVSFSSAEVCLQLYYRVPTRRTDAGWHLPVTCGGSRSVRTSEKLHGISILRTDLRPNALPKVGGEIRFVIAAACHVRMGCYLPPRFQMSRGVN